MNTGNIKTHASLISASDQLLEVISEKTELIGRDKYCTLEKSQYLFAKAALWFSFPHTHAGRRENFSELLFSFVIIPPAIPEPTTG